MKGGRFLGVGGNRSARKKLAYNHWLAALVKGKCSSTKPTRLATGVICHPDTEQNRPYKILALPGFEPGTYCTTSENFTNVPHYSILYTQRYCTELFQGAFLVWRTFDDRSHSLHWHWQNPEPSLLVHEGSSGTRFDYHGQFEIETFHISAPPYFKSVSIGRNEVFLLKKVEVNAVSIPQRAPLLGLDPWPFRVRGKPVNRWTTLPTCVTKLGNFVVRNLNFRPPNYVF